MLAKLVDELPVDGWLYEPKWDGFRCLAARAGAEVTLMSRHGRPFSRYFPELVEAFAALADRDVTIDGEVMLETDRGSDFAALMSRLHPAPSRVERLRRETPARFIAFDLIWRDGRDLQEMPFAARRSQLQEVVPEGSDPLLVTPLTDDVETARGWLRASDGAGIDGVIAKSPGSRYE